MAEIGQALKAPESGWKRIDDTDSNITYGANKSYNVNATSYNGGFSQVSGIGMVYKFNFKGTKLRFISRIYEYSDNISVKIDGVIVGNFKLNYANVYQALTFEVLGLENKEHYVEVINNVNKIVQLDAIDIDEDGELRPYNEYPFVRRMVLKNPTTNQHYSLAEKTLIPLPDASDKNMILHGIEASKEIQLDESFDKIVYPVEIEEANKNADGFIVGYKDVIEKPLSIKFE